MPKGVYQRKPKPKRLCACGRVHFCKGLCQVCHRIANRKERRDYNRAWSVAHPGAMMALVKKWREEHPEQARANERVKGHKRRARKANNGGSWTAAEWETLKRQYGYRCVGCGKTETELKAMGRQLSPDHIIPLSKKDCEGRPGLNSIENIQPLCIGKGVGNGGCQLRKGAKFHDFVIS